MQVPHFYAATASPRQPYSPPGIASPKTSSPNGRSEGQMSPPAQPAAYTGTACDLNPAFKQVTEMTPLAQFQLLNINAHQIHVKNKELFAIRTTDAFRIAIKSFKGSILLKLMLDHYRHPELPCLTLILELREHFETLCMQECKVPPSSFSRREADNFSRQDMNQSFVNTLLSMYAPVSYESSESIRNVQILKLAKDTGGWCWSDGSSVFRE